MAERPLVARIRRILKKEEQSMQVSRKTVGLVFGGLLALAVLIVGYYTRPTFAAPDGASVSVDTAKEGSKAESKAEDASNGRYASGVVVDDHKRAVEGAEVRLYETNRQWSSERFLRKTLTDAKGRFRLSLSLGEKHGNKLTVTKRGFASLVFWGSPLDVFHELSLSKPQSLRGRVTGPDGQPVRGADVWTPDLEEPITGIESAKTDANGYFEIPDLEAWQGEGNGGLLSTPTPEHRAEIKAQEKLDSITQALRVGHPDYGVKLGQYSQVPATVNVAFHKPAIVTGRVVDQSAGTPLRGFLARLQNADGNPDFAYADAITDERGGFRVLLQGAGACKLWFECEPAVAKGEFAARQVEAVPGAQLDLGTIRVDLGKQPSPATSAPAAEKPKANDPSGKTSAKPADEAPPASGPSATKAGANTESKPGPTPALTTESNAEQAKAIAEIEKLGGSVTRDEKDPGKPVIGVYLTMGLRTGTSKVSDDDLACLKGLTQLRLLWLTGTNVTGSGLAYLKDLTRLQDLDLRYTPLTDAGLEHLKGLTHLKRLLLVETQVTDAGLEQLKGLTELQELFLWHTNVTDAGLEHLKGLTQLQKLVLTYTKVTDAGLEHLIGLTNLRSLDLGARVTDAGLEKLKGLTQLRSLDLAGAKVTDAGLEHLKALQGMLSLDLGHTKVTDAGLLPLAGLINLEFLGLTATKITDAGLEHLKGQTKLRQLDLRSTPVTDAGLEHLRGLTKLERLLLDDTKVTDEGVKKLQRALPKCEIGYKTAEEHSTPAAPEPATPKANDPSGKTSAKPADEVSSHRVRVSKDAPFEQPSPGEAGRPGARHNGHRRRLLPGANPPGQGRG